MRERVRFWIRNFGLGFSVLLVLAHPVLAAKTTDEVVEIGKIVQRLGNMILYLSSFTAAVFLAWGGLKYIGSQGNPVRQAEAKQTMLNSCLGLIIILLARFIVAGVANLVEL